MTYFLDHKVIDLSHTIHPDSPTWPGDCGYHLKNITHYGEDLFCVQQVQHACGIGTHIDAPAHRHQGGHTIENLPLDALMGPLAIIDITRQANQNANYAMTVEDVIANINKYGAIQKGSFVLISSGWSKRFENAAAYRNVVDERQMAFPYCAVAAAELLMAQDILGLGIDTLSPDGGAMRGTFPVHTLLLGAGRIIIENLNMLERLPARGAHLQVLPVKFAGATEASVRPLAFLPR